MFDDWEDHHGYVDVEKLAKRRASLKRAFVLFAVAVVVLLFAIGAN